MAGVERQLGEIDAAPVGRPSYGPLVLLKCLLLQQWCRLSDPGLGEALSDRLSFRRFVGLALADPVPDHSTLSRFRSELVRRGLSERLLAELNRQLNARRLMVALVHCQIDVASYGGYRGKAAGACEPKSIRPFAWRWAGPGLLASVG